MIAMTNAIYFTILVRKKGYMPTANQVKALIKSHFDENSERFITQALQIAAHEARLGHIVFANEIKQIIDSSNRNRPILKPISQNLQDLVMEFTPHERLSNLIVSDHIKNRIKRIIKEYAQKDKLRLHDLKNRRKILFSGPAGTGKTMTASIVANELKMPLYVVLIDKLVTKFMGETSAKLRQIFDMIKDRPGVYLFDEFDAIGSSRSKDNDVGEIRRVLNAFLQFLERDSSDSIIIAATNNILLLDQALFRRFDDVIRYDLPSDKDKLELLKLYLCGFVKEHQLRPLLKSLDSLSHAEIVQACMDAIKESVLNNKHIVDIKVLKQMIEDRKSAYIL